VDAVVIAAGLSLAAVFLVSGIAKLVDLPGARQAVRDFGVPRRYTRLLGTMLPVAELLVVALLVVPATRVAGALAAFGLLALFNVAIAANLRRGRAPNCRCFGQLHSSPVGWRTIGRNGGLMLVALAVATHGLAESVTVALALALTGALAALLFSLADTAWWVRLRGQAASPATAVTEDSPPPEQVAVAPDDGEADAPLPQLPVGSIAPAFQLPDVAGDDVSLDVLLRGSRPVVLVFIDPECDICESILPGLVTWQQANASSVTLQIISSGPVDQNKAKAERFGIASLLVQEDWEVADAYGSETVPSAILVRPDGTTGSGVADGPGEIRGLLRRVTRRSAHAGVARPG
jgi:peroxiredoxin/uncharacterized membrane protein YphA (DoxX/SURF4 family)